jgi:hypothetical protein
MNNPQCFNGLCRLAWTISTLNVGGIKPALRVWLTPKAHQELQDLLNPVDDIVATGYETISGLKEVRIENAPRDSTTTVALEDSQHASSVRA